MNRPSAKWGCVAVLVALGALAFVAVMITVIVTVGIWPGEAKLTAPLFCPDDKPDVFVVADSYSTSPGETSYNFGLYCMGPRGEIANKGFFGPFVVLTLAHAALVVGLLVLVIVVLRIRRSRSRPSDVGPSSPAPP